jgi:hypothetical protein
MTDDGIFKTGDLVVGSSDPSKSVYSPTGAKLNDNGVRLYGSSEDIEAQRREISRSATRFGGKTMTTSLSGKERKGKRKKQNQLPTVTYEHALMAPEENFAYSNPEPVPERSLQTVHFENDFGKIRAKVEDLVEHEQAFMLVFSDEDSLVFEPKVGEMLLLYTPAAEAYTVYYPGVTFNSPDSSKKLMILFKVPAENQE